MQVNEDVLASIALRDLDALRALVDSQRHQIVTLLMEAPLTAKELAEQLGIGRTRLYYHLDLLERHELIRVVDTRVVSGITERRYRAVARNFRVDRALLAGEATGAEISETQAGIIEAVAADLRLDSDPHDDELLVFRAFRRLSAARRRELRARLVELANEYAEDDPGGADLEFSIALFARKKRA
jgi:DNA-binding transcriptional ArsR family regulator